MKLRYSFATYIISLCAVIGLASCTHNNGDIGPWFGTWKLDRILVDGSVDGAYDGTVFWKFQSDVICMEQVDDLTHTRVEHWGTWSDGDGLLTLTFTYSDSNYPAGSFKYVPPVMTHLSAGVSGLEILRLNGSDMHLSYTSADGAVYQYILSKW